MDEDRGLLQDISTDDISGKAVRGGAVVFGAMAVQKALALALMAVLARLLTPEDYGLFGMVFALAAFLQVFADLGLSMATVQKMELSRAQISTLFWVNLAFSALLSCAAAAAAPVVALFYREPRLLGITLWIAPGFLLAGLGTQHAALMQRNMRFGALAACDIAGLAAGGAVGVWMALVGLGVYSLVGQSLAQVGTRSALAWALSGWVPGRPVRRSGVRPMLRFGGYLTGFSVLNYFARNMDKVLLGRFWGATPLGLYTRAYALMTYPITLVSGPMNSIMIPAMSKLQRDLNRFQEIYLRGLRVVALLSFPMMTVLFVAAEEVIAIIYGPQWTDAVPLFRILCIAGLWQGIYNFTGQVYIATGRTDRLFQYGLAGTPIIVAGICCGAPFGPRGVATGYAVAMLLVLIPYSWSAYRIIRLPLVAAGGVLASPLTGALVMAVLTWILRHALPTVWSAIWRGTVLVLFCAVVFVLQGVLFHRSEARSLYNSLAGKG